VGNVSGRGKEKSLRGEHGTEESGGILREMAGDVRAQNEMERWNAHLAEVDQSLCR